MIKAEIRTDAGSYTVALEAATTLKEGYDIVEKTLADGLPFEGDELLVICADAKLKHIRVYEAAAQVMPPFMKPDDVEPPAPPTGPYVFTTDRATFLGHKLTVRGQAIEKDSHTYYLPMEVNDAPALDMLGPEKLEEFLHYWKMSQGSDGTGYTVVVPPSQLPDYEEAVEYLKDYVAETAPTYEPQERNAKAWQGWKENK